MSIPKIHKEDTIAQEAIFPREFESGDSVTLRVEDDSPTKYSAVIKNKSEGRVAAPLSQVNWDNHITGEGTVYIDWKIEYSDGTIEILPPDGDEWFIYE